MRTPSPFPLLAGLAEQFVDRLQPPAWMAHEVQHRLVLLLNHVLMQEPEARARLLRVKGQRVQLRWRQFTLGVQATPAGLLELDGTGAPDLTLTVSERSPWRLAQQALQGDKPPVSIQGDVQLAAEVNWLADHVRWDIEEDVARLIGDAPAHALGQAVGGAAAALRRFLVGVVPGGRQSVP